MKKLLILLFLGLATSCGSEGKREIKNKHTIEDEKRVNVVILPTLYRPYNPAKRVELSEEFFKLPSMNRKVYVSTGGSANTLEGDFLLRLNVAIENASGVDQVQLNYDIDTYILQDGNSIPYDKKTYSSPVFGNNQFIVPIFYDFKKVASLTSDYIVVIKLRPIVNEKELVRSQRTVNLILVSAARYH